MAKHTSKPLQGHTFVVTRPAEQAQTLIQRIQDYGGQTVAFPLLAIAALEDDQAVYAHLQQMHTFDALIFVSSNAVEQFFLRAQSMSEETKQLPCFVVGPATAAAAKKFGMRNVIMPSQHFDSEGLLALPQLADVSQQRILLIRGIGGRDLIANTLQQRGAEIHICACYQRLPAQKDCSLLDRIWEEQGFSAILLTSSEAVRLLLDLAQHKAWLSSCKLVVHHPRLITQLQALSPQQTFSLVLAKSTDDEALIHALLQEFD